MRRRRTREITYWLEHGTPVAMSADTLGVERDYEDISLASLRRIRRLARSARLPWTPYRCETRAVEEFETTVARVWR